ncbi:BQ5605_C059g12709 [Microbotryum silenes-dioicae]|uniref:BQ5605_C018g08569 protein n=1 Tax=Microbotryum silenes-dioicae TaxID=796604 RepID=A0A2X0M0E5_9BASI|nr:BQ5605_C018g08569 [Microbotryum silenes-dioicae]SGZ29018.1 BQ5605_C059g12709 [Microbotryum silenes-dioicae]
MVRSFALVKIYGMAREGRLVSLYWIAFLSAPTAQQPALEIQPREDIRRCRGDDGPSQPEGLQCMSPSQKKKKKKSPGLVLEMISSGRWGMQKWGTRMEGVVRRRIILEERLKLRAGGAWGRRGQ